MTTTKRFVRLTSLVGRDYMWVEDGGRLRLSKAPTIEHVLLGKKWDSPDADLIPDVKVFIMKKIGGEISITTDDSE